MNVTLPKDLEEFVHKKIAKGPYPDVSAVVAEALREWRANQIDPEEDSPELEAWLLEAEGSPESPYNRTDLEVIRRKVLSERQGKCR